MRSKPVLLGSLLGAGLVLATQVSAAAAAKIFKNCAEMRKTYIGGVAKPGAVDRRVGGGHAKYPPTISATLYAANAKSDRDKDGIACEQ